MPNYIRPPSRLASVFFTVCLARRGSTLLTDEIDLLRSAVVGVMQRRPFRVDAWVVLPDHMHAVWTLPPGDPDYSERWGSIKAHFSKHLRLAGRAPEPPACTTRGGVNPALRKGEVGIWQRRFWEHHIRDAADFHAHIAHCWDNPVKHGLVREVSDWPYSSWHRDHAVGRGSPRRTAPCAERKAG